jgi:glycyl-tRNA synthetase alpha subunit
MFSSFGTRVTLVEKHSGEPGKQANRLKSKFEFVEVIVEPTPDNRN